MEENVLASIAPTAIKFDVNEKQIVAFFACATDQDGNPALVENAETVEVIKITVTPESLRFFVDQLIVAGRQYEDTYKRNVGFSLEEEVEQYEQGRSKAE